jgi:hypothetical protein
MELRQAEMFIEALHFVYKRLDTFKQPISWNVN